MKQTGWAHTGLAPLDSVASARVRGEANEHMAPQLSSSVQISHKNLPFYEDFGFYRFVEPRLDAFRTRFALRRPGEVYVFSGNRSAIETVNQRAPLNLSLENVTEYCRMFFAMVNDPGEGGSFDLIESVEDLPFEPSLAEDQKHAWTQRLGTLIEPLDPETRTGPFLYWMWGTVAFLGALFACRIAVAENGQMAVFDEEVILDNLPFTKPSAFVQTVSEQGDA